MKVTHEVELHLQSEEHVKRFEEKYGKRYKSTEEQLEDILDKVVEMVVETAEKGGNYNNDSIRVKIEMEYLPEDK